MPRESFERNLQHLVDQVLVLGSHVADAILDSVDALQRRDHASARRIFDADQHINEQRYAIEHECLTLIATQQPMARDVRFLAAILEIITELERIGDYAKGISKINLLMGDELIDQSTQISLKEMTDRGLDMLRRALDAFIKSDSDTARRIPLEDDMVDQLYYRLYRQLVDQMMVSPSTVDHCNHLMWVAHNLERMADRVTNICERVVYSATGEMKELDSPEGIDVYHGKNMD